MSNVPNPLPAHAAWCQRQAQEHAACYALLTSVAIAADARATVELNKAAGVPALITLTIDRGAHRQLVPLHIEAAHLVGRALERAVDLLTRSAT